jgi:hypothetical protein
MGGFADNLSVKEQRAMPYRLTYRLEKQTIADQEIVLTNEQKNFLGPELTFENCRLIFRCAHTSLIITRTKFINCRIEIRRKLVNFQWLHAWLQDCKFTGTLRGNDFGHWPPAFEDMAGIRDCDFSEATLDRCRFVDCPIETIALPKWPCFTILNPRQNRSRFETIKSPVDLSFLSRPYIPPPENAVAITYHAPSFLKEEKLEGSEENLKATLESLDFVLL